jgi:hypothetical protein
MVILHVDDAVGKCLQIVSKYDNERLALLLDQPPSLYTRVLTEMKAMLDWMNEACVGKWELVSEPDKDFSEGVKITGIEFELAHDAMLCKTRFG